MKNFISFSGGVWAAFFLFFCAEASAGFRCGPKLAQKGGGRTASQIALDHGIQFLMFDIDPESYWKILPGRSLAPRAHQPGLTPKNRLLVPIFQTEVPMRPFGTVTSRRGRDHVIETISRAHSYSNGRVFVRDDKWRMMLLFPVSILDTHQFYLSLADNIPRYTSHLPLAEMDEVMSEADKEGYLERLYFRFGEPVKIEWARSLWIPAPLIGHVLDPTQYNEYLMEAFGSTPLLSGVRKIDDWYHEFPNWAELYEDRQF